ncbi:uncharacterized protein LOC113018292 [Astatotilapia calliptera]|uniref:uncharacterized protein LOC113018292 n=1 Tax=Astatotilapia calliptera TaxID=8154 RepID=UPI000E41098B|nr:uncharacterized protein LOC113018292 [Astatotilapia calliptera]
MEVTGLGMRLMVMALFLLMAENQKCCHAQKSEGAYLHVHPNRLQFFEYDSISLNCSGFHGPAEWRVIKKLGLNSTQWETSTRTLYIKPAFKSHSGEYWCEKEDGEKSSTVNITITSGDVILEIPAFPVMEGENVTLGCRKKGMPSNLPADFYKDGHNLETGYGGKITIPNVSKSNEGLYKCIFSESQGKSPESWLTVRVDIVTTPQETIPREYERSPEETPNSTEPSILLSAVFTTLGVAVLVVIGVLYHQKHRGVGESSAFWYDGCRLGLGRRRPDPEDIYLKLYNESVRDLLRRKSTQTYNLRVREHPKGGPYVADGGRKHQPHHRQRRHARCQQPLTRHLHHQLHTAGAVILENPVVPVKEGEVVTFICRSTMAPSAHIADFFKDDNTSTAAPQAR